MLVQHCRSESAFSGWLLALGRVYNEHVRPVPVIIIFDTLTVPLSHRVGEDVSGKKCLHIPFGSTLGLPSPEDPTSGLLKGIQLGFDEATNVVLVIRAEGVNGSRILSIAAADVIRGSAVVVVSTIVSAS